MSSFDIVQTFQNSGLHSNRFQHVSRAYAVVQYHDKYRDILVSQTKTNNWGDHAEKVMIQHLEDVLEREALDSQTIKLYVNFSPCSECSTDIMAFLERAEQYYDIELKLEIVFAHLYRIQRPTCLDDSHSRNHRLPGLYDHRKNVKGLKTLVRFGVLLYPFIEDDWESLCDAVGCPEQFSPERYQLGGREGEDDNLWQDMEQLGLLP